MEKLKYFYIRKHCGILERVVFVEWLRHVVGSGNDFPVELYPIINVKKPGNEERMLEALMNYYYPDFEVYSRDNFPIARRIACEYSQLLLDQKIKPIEFCGLVNALDAFEGDTYSHENIVTSTDNVLGDLWNACDYCDESWTNANSHHLIEEAQRYLIEYAADNNEQVE